MARIEWVEQRLDRWALWRTRTGGGGSSHPMWRGAPPDARPARASIPLSDEECWQTDKAVADLALTEPAIAETLAVFYLRGTQAAQHDMAISRAVLSQRLGKAHTMLAAVWSRVGPLEKQLPGSFTPLTK